MNQNPVGVGGKAVNPQDSTKPCQNCTSLEDFRQELNFTANQMRTFKIETIANVKGFPQEALRLMFDPNEGNARRMMWKNIGDLKYRWDADILDACHGNGQRLEFFWSRWMNFIGETSLDQPQPFKKDQTIQHSGENALSGEVSSSRKRCRSDSDESGTITSEQRQDLPRLGDGTPIPTWVDVDVRVLTDVVAKTYQKAGKTIYLRLSALSSIEDWEDQCEFDQVDPAILVLDNLHDMIIEHCKGYNDLFKMDDWEVWYKRQDGRIFVVRSSVALQYIVGHWLNERYMDGVTVLWLRLRKKAFDQDDDDISTRPSVDEANEPAREAQHPALGV